MRNIILALVIPLLLILGQENGSRIAEWIARQLARQLPRRAERREAEWLADLDQLPSGYTRLFHALGYVRATLAAQEQHLLLVLLGLVVSTMRLIARVVAGAIVLSSPYWIATGVLDGSIQWNDLPTLLFFLTYITAGIQTDARDFGWMPRIKFSDRVNAPLALANILALPTMILVGDLKWKIMGAIALVGYLLILTPVFQKVLEVRRTSARK